MHPLLRKAGHLETCACLQVARARAPSVLFFDEADALCSQRSRGDEHEASRRFKAELLQQLDGLWEERRSPPEFLPPDTRTAAGNPASTAANRVVVIAATNAPW